MRYEGLAAGAMRHRDHRFEWTRAEFAAWAAGVGERTATPSTFLPVGDDDPEVGPPTQMAVFTRADSRPGGVMSDLAIPELSLVVAGRRLRLRQVDVRARALRRLRGDLQRLLPRPGRRRRERPGRHRRRLRGAALHRRQAPGRRPADGRRRDQRAARGPTARWSSWPGPTTCCRSRSCSTCPSRSASRATRRGPTATSARTSSAASATSCAARCAAWPRRASARSTCCAASRRSPRRSIVREKLLNDFRDQHGPVRRHRRRARLPLRAGDPARASSATRSSATSQGRPVDAEPPRGRRGGLRRRPRRPRPRHAPACCAW